MENANQIFSLERASGKTSKFYSLLKTQLVSAKICYCQSHCDSGEQWFLFKEKW